VCRYQAEECCKLEIPMFSHAQICSCYDNSRPYRVLCTSSPTTIISMDEGLVDNVSEQVYDKVKEI
jgi:hypothetical protein